MSKTFKCAMCGCVDKCRPEKESLAELKEEFGNVNVEDCVKVCDACWEIVRPKNNPDTFIDDIITC